MSQAGRLKVMVCDDEEGVSRNWACELEKTVGADLLSITPLSPEDVSDAASCLEDRQAAARKSRATPTGTHSCLIDEADVLIVDYDLLALRTLDGRRSTIGETGERLAYLARCFSTCGYILALNQFNRAPTFDLSLRGHLESFADLNLSSQDISNEWLWREAPASEVGFRPWYWPNVPVTAQRLTQRVEELLADIKKLDEPVLQLLGLDTDSELRAHWMTGQLDFLGSRREDGQPGSTFEITPRDFVTRSGNGVNGKDQAAGDEAIVRIFVHRIHKWLERQVLPAQEIVIDAPHLVSRFSSVLGSQDAEQLVWDRDNSIADRLGAEVRRHRVLDGWTTRPVWDWRTLRNDPAFPEVSDPWSARLSSSVFLEDTSSFDDRSNAKAFQASVWGPIAQRHTSEGVKDVEYAPLLRYLLGDG